MQQEQKNGQQDKLDNLTRQLETNALKRAELYATSSTSILVPGGRRRLKAPSMQTGCESEAAVTAPAALQPFCCENQRRNE
jgi:hypothetical protein